MDVQWDGRKPQAKACGYELRRNIRKERERFGMQFLTLLIAEGEGAAQGQGGGAPLWSSFIWFLPILFILYFVMIRPQRRQEQTQKALIAGLKKNDKVQTIGGIIGTVVSVAEKEDEVVIRVDDNSRLRMIKSSIARNLRQKTA
jgi:preprotein translocase subunit YajC